MTRALRATLAAHADWSVDPRKRWMTVAHRSAAGWSAAAPRPVGALAPLLADLTRQAGGGAVALGMDLPLGLPRAFAQRHADTAGFPGFLRGLRDRPGFLQVAATLDEVSPARPFYPARGAKGMTRDSHAARLGLDRWQDYSRLCDRATAARPAGAPLFWTLGANQTGKAAIAAWRDLLIPALHGPAPPLLWPFDGDLLDLLHPGRVVIAETYPAEALRQLDLPLRGSKRRAADRRALAGGLHAALAALHTVADAALCDAIAAGFGEDAAGEDRFDSLLGLLCVLTVLAGHRPDGIPDDPALRLWEGWVLGQTDLPR